MTEEILQINENFSLDESIEKYEEKAYSPIKGTTDLNNAGEIRIEIQQQDKFLHPSESYLLFKGRVTKTDGSSFEDKDMIGFCNNGIMHMFNYIEYEISNKQIEYLNYPGQATTMLGILNYSKVFTESEGLNMMFYKDTGGGEADITKNNGFAMRRRTLIVESEPKGTFSFIVPLKHIFGFADDYNNVIWGCEHQLTLKRKDDNDALFKSSETTEGNITLDKLTWYMPHVVPSLEQKNKLFKNIENKSSLNVGYRSRRCFSKSVAPPDHFIWNLAFPASEKPRWVIVGFQTNKKSSQDKNPSIFDHLDLKQIYVTLNGEKYPEVEYDLSFSKQDFSRVYRHATNFKSKFNGTDEKTLIMPIDYKNLYPLFVFDVSKQSERIKFSRSDIEVNAFFP